jgi:hypothetical protein
MTSSLQNQYIYKQHIWIKDKFYKKFHEIMNANFYIVIKILHDVFSNVWD